MDLNRFRLVGALAPCGLRGYDAAALSDELGVETGEDTLVQQAFRDEVDVNTIVARFGMSRTMPFGSAEGVYGDFSGITDYESALAKIRDADARFMTLPADVRERFGNDPGELIRFVASSTPEELGAVFNPPVPPSAPVAPAAPVAPPGAG